MSEHEEIVRLRAELAANYELSLAEGKRREELLAKVSVELDRLRAAARQDAEEIARLREALTGVRKDLAPIHICDAVHPHCKICDAVLRIDAALTCRPQGEKL